MKTNKHEITGVAKPAHTPTPWRLHDTENSTVCGPEHLSLALCELDPDCKYDGHRWETGETMTIREQVIIGLYQIINKAEGK